MNNFGYDMSSAQYSPDGLVLQIDYAAKAVDKSHTVIGIRGKDAVVLAVDKVVTSKLYEPDADGRIFNLDKHIGMAVAGLSADGYCIAEMARQEVTSFRKRLTTGIPVKQLCERIAGYVHAYTLYGAVRPFGLSILLASWDEEDGPQLYKIEPSGSFFGYYACASGKAKLQAMDEIDELHLSDMETEELVKSAGEIIYKIHDDFQDGDFRFEMGIVGQSTCGRHLINPPQLTEMACSAGEAFQEQDDSDDYST